MVMHYSTYLYLKTNTLQSMAAWSPSPDSKFLPWSWKAAIFGWDQGKDLAMEEYWVFVVQGIIGCFPIMFDSLIQLHCHTFVSCHIINYHQGACFLHAVMSLLIISPFQVSFLVFQIIFLLSFSCSNGNEIYYLCSNTSVSIVEHVNKPWLAHGQRCI